MWIFYSVGGDIIITNGYIVYYGRIPGQILFLSYTAPQIQEDL